MIAQLDLKHKQAVLEDDGTWTSADAMFARVLNLSFSPKDSGSCRALPDYGLTEASAAAGRFGGTIKIEQRPHKNDPSIVY
jgi:hypothetical protein